MEKPSPPFKITTAAALIGSAVLVGAGGLLAGLKLWSVVTGAYAASGETLLGTIGMTATGLFYPALAIGAGFLGVATAQKTKSLSEELDTERKAARANKKSPSPVAQGPSILTEKKGHVPALVTGLAQVAGISMLLGGCLIAGLFTNVLGLGVGLAFGVTGYSIYQTGVFAGAARAYAKSPEGDAERREALAAARNMELGQLYLQSKRLTRELDTAINNATPDHTQFSDSWQAKIRTERLRAASRQMQDITDMMNR